MALSFMVAASACANQSIPQARKKESKTFGAPGAASEPRAQTMASPETTRPKTIDASATAMNPAPRPKLQRVSISTALDLEALGPSAATGTLELAALGADIGLLFWGSALLGLYSRVGLDEPCSCGDPCRSA